MAIRIDAPWHKASFDAFIQDALPRLLAQRVPLDSYVAEPAGAYTCRLIITLAAKSGDLRLEIPDVPQPDVDGVFEIEGKRFVVPPLASREELDQAQIRCVGEQLLGFVEDRLGEAPADLTWDANLARAWLPINAWVREFILAQQPLDETNWLARTEHLRMIVIPERKEIFCPAQIGYACPIQTPEGTNIGKVLRVALGAEIRDGRMARIDEQPGATLSLGASMVPLLEHSDANRLLMGVNMMRQWLPPTDPEPALVQTGNEPDAPECWCGRNLLTAFISLGIDTHEDAIVISESAAKRMNQGRPLEVGDKLSNRHGTKGTISRILPDEQMPHLPDGTPVDLVYSRIALHTRMNFGQQREAVMSRIARAEGKPAVVPPFRAPPAAEIQSRLRHAGLDPSGMERLSSRRDGTHFDMPSLVGWIYWGKTFHLAAEKIHATVDHQRANVQGELEYLRLREAGAFEIINETFNTRATTRDDIATLADRVAAGGPIEQAAPPSPGFARTVRRLDAAGIRAEKRFQEPFPGSPPSDHALSFHFATPAGKRIALARPVPHPWAEGRELTEVGVLDGLPQYPPLIEANDRLRRLLQQKAPPSMLDRATAQLQQRFGEYFGALFPMCWQPHGNMPPLEGCTWATNHLMENVRVAFSGRTVISPGRDLRIDQIGLAEDIAWTIYGPFVDRELGHGAAATRDGKSAAVLDRIMAEMWILLNRAPSVLPTSLLAFHAVRIPEKVIRIHPLVCMLLNADFDGDQAAVFLPITAAGQQEAGEKLSVAAHLRRDPDLLRWVIPPHAALVGLARLSLTPAGREQIERLVGQPVETPCGFLTRSTVEQAAKVLLQRDGVDKTLETLDRLMRLGFNEARQSGASISPFFGSTVALPEPPHGDDPDAWKAYGGQIAARLASLDRFDDPDVGPQVLTVRSGARGSVQNLVNLVGSRGVLPGLDGRPFIFRNGFVQGLAPQELLVHAMHARRALGQVALDTTQAAYGIRSVAMPQGLGVLARAMRADKPGVVFARAALAGETDPLTDLDSRLFIGLPAKPTG